MIDRWNAVIRRSAEEGRTGRKRHSSRAKYVACESIEELVMKKKNTREQEEVLVQLPPSVITCCLADQ